MACALLCAELLGVAKGRNVLYCVFPVKRGLICAVALDPAA